MSPSKNPGQKDAASKTFLKKQAEAQGLGAPNAPAHKEAHAPGEAPVASDSGITDVGIEGGTTNVPGEKGITGVRVRDEIERQGNSMVQSLDFVL
ncbi:hypothetical protein F5B19DRAFT_496975 [Rostrohypoxylon terebratum]|nr:hypothetical protein F5B19DRAFT_496975 [Rostrohypoxylon terebratum]